MATSRTIMAFVCLMTMFGAASLRAAGPGESAELDFQSSSAAARGQMVTQQIRSRGIKDPRILAAFMTVERHRFVPEKYLPYAYDDRPLPIGQGQTISQPYIVALMTDVLGLSKSDRVLEVGTGSGYQAAILAELCQRVFSIEIIASLGESARKRLKKLGYANVEIKTGDGYQGWKEEAPFDAIIVTCSPTHVPKPLVTQLKEGGRMIIPVGTAYDQKLVLLRKTQHALKQVQVLPVRFVPMVDAAGKRY